jgi:hypothetical protein
MGNKLGAERKAAQAHQRMAKAKEPGGLLLGDARLARFVRREQTSLPCPPATPTSRPSWTPSAGAA